jgi:hypothetical protein
VILGWSGVVWLQKKNTRDETGVIVGRKRVFDREVQFLTGQKLA